MQIEYSAQPLPLIEDAAIAILQSKWYREHTDNIVSVCVDLLKPTRCRPPEIHIVPGALEMPFAAQTLARTKRLDAIVCVGAIMKGETLHFDMIVDECIRGLGQVMLVESIPIIVEVIPTLNIEQLIARSASDKFNKGIEAAQATAEIIAWRRQLASADTRA